MTPACRTTCTNSGYSNPFSNDKHYAGSNYGIDANIDTIKKEIMTYGSAAAGMDVYEDFFGYSSGVYYPVSGNFAGAHGVRIIGWGSSGGLNYWLVANSWSNEWGEAGYFRIKMGTCGIELSVNAGRIASSEIPALLI